MSSEAEKARPQLEVRAQAADSIEAAVWGGFSPGRILAVEMEVREDVGRAMAGYADALGRCGEDAALRELSRHGK